MYLCLGKYVRNGKLQLPSGALSKKRVFKRQFIARYAPGQVLQVKCPRATVRELVHYTCVDVFVIGLKS